jgi:hypothetical protein
MGALPASTIVIRTSQTLRRRGCRSVLRHSLKARTRVKSLVNFASSFRIALTLNKGIGAPPFGPLLKSQGVGILQMSRWTGAGQRTCETRERPQALLLGYKGAEGAI